MAQVGNPGTEFARLRQARSRDVAAVQGLGNRLRLRRKVRRMTLADVAGAAGISTAQLSQIERGNAMPSVDRLVLLCAALGMPMSWLIDTEGAATPQDDPHVVRRAAQRHMSFPQSGMDKAMLTPDSMLKVQMMRIVLQPVGGTGAVPYSEPEGAKCGLVLRGVLGLEIDGQARRLDAGDSFAFDATASVRFWAEGVETEVIWVTTPAFY